MESIIPQIEELTSNIDDLELALKPILQTALSASTSKLPLLDKAKLYVLATYAIESILFSVLKLNNVDAKAHPIFQELSRVKEYFNKLKNAEANSAGPTQKLDKSAAGRFIKAGLSGNAKYDAERKMRQEKEMAGAKRKLEDMGGVGTHTRFRGAAKRMRDSEGESVTVVKASEVDEEDAEEEDKATGQTSRQARGKRTVFEDVETPAESEADVTKAKGKNPSAEYLQIQQQIQALKAKTTKTEAEEKQLKKLRKKRKKMDAA